jgi:hypothetical protein
MFCTNWVTRWAVACPADSEELIRKTKETLSAFLELSLVKALLKNCSFASRVSTKSIPGNTIQIELETRPKYSAALLPQKLRENILSKSEKRTIFLSERSMVTPIKGYKISLNVNYIYENSSYVILTIDVRFKSSLEDFVYQRDRGFWTEINNTNNWQGIIIRIASRGQGRD